MVEFKEGNRIWTKLDNDFVESAKVFEVKENTLIVGYETFNQTVKKFERDKENVFISKEKARNFKFSKLFTGL